MELDDHIKRLLKWPEDELGELLSSNPLESLDDEHKSLNVIFFSQDEMDAYMASYSDAEESPKILATVRNRIRKLHQMYQVMRMQQRPRQVGEKQDVDSSIPTSDETKDALTERLAAIRQRQEEKLAQQDLFEKIEIDECVELLTEEENEALEKARRERSKLLPVRHVNKDFFLADLVDYAFKDDAATMEAPVFSLATKPDLTTWTWKSKDDKRRMEITPSVRGRATIHDKDVLIYVTSQMTEALNRGRPDTDKRVVRFTVYDYLVTTNKHTSGREYNSFQTALRRLSGTRIYTNIETGDIRIKQDFGIIDKWEIVEKSEDDEKMIAVEITLSEWLYNAIQAHEVLTLHPDYFRLRKPIDRRLYELARKHCGHQAQWSIGLHLLHEKSGSHASIYEFHEAVKTLADSDHLPEYRVSVGTGRRLAEVKVTFYTRDAKRLMRSLIK